jgi:uncharacterized protein YqgV (UPF0045/DUF77 family)
MPAMLKKPLLLLALACAFGAAHAQSTPAKKEAVARILKVQQAGIETIARNLAEQPAVELLAAAERSLPQRVAADKQQAVIKDIQADTKKYLDEAVPLVQGRAVKLAPTTIGTLLEEKFTEEELKQVASILENPAYVKFQQFSPDMQKVLVEKVIADTRSSIEPKVRTLESSIGKRLGVTAPAGAPAKPASK